MFRLERNCILELMRVTLKNKLALCKYAAQTRNLRETYSR